MYTLGYRLAERPGTSRDTQLGDLVLVLGASFPGPNGLGLRVCIQCARGGCASLEMGVRRLIGHLRQHIGPPQPPHVFSSRV